MEIMTVGIILMKTLFTVRKEHVHRIALDVQTIGVYLQPGKLLIRLVTSDNNVELSILKQRGYEAERTRFAIGLNVKINKCIN